MNFNKYIKKIYTIAYWLTGDENSANHVATLAISKNANNIKENDIDLSLLHITAKEVCNIFLLHPEKYTSVSNQNTTHIQDSLLTLEPLSRVTLVWRDMMGYNINDLTTQSNSTKEELYKKLNIARKQVLRSIKETNYEIA